MTVLFADDEPVARQILREALEEVPGLTVIGEASNGLEALDLARKLSPDLLLLDLEMPGMNGFQVSGAFSGSRPPVVIFVTAYDEHALAAFDAGAVDYLLKPVRKERLRAAIEKARAQLGSVQSPAPLRKIVGRLGSDLHLLDPAEVIAFQAEGETVYIVTAKSRFYCALTLKALEERLPADQFRRVHRATIINTNQIRKISPLSSKRWLLRMSNGLEVIVSKRLSGAIRNEAGW